VPRPGVPEAFGATYEKNRLGSRSHDDGNGGPQEGWIEVTFRGNSGRVLPKTGEPIG
jgi:hypothetical protein